MKFLYFIFLLLAIGCQSSNTASDNPTQEIKKLLDQSRKAHFEGDPDLLVSNSADSIISVNAGKVSISTPAKVKESMSDYLKNTHFIKWDDEMEPIIRFSEDKSMAYAIVRKLVIIKDKKAASSVPPRYFTLCMDQCL